MDSFTRRALWVAFLIGWMWLFAWEAGAKDVTQDLVRSLARIERTLEKIHQDLSSIDAALNGKAGHRNVADQLHSIQETLTRGPQGQG